MNGAAFYNEHDGYAAQWLRNLGAAGHVTPGIVDERSIRELRPADVAGFRRAHFFAGIGVWDYALGRAGWGDAPVWTGSCPCQPFSAAGKRKGLADDRHLWPEWFRLIRECRPAIILGEQVASAGDWLDVVSRDMEGEGYSFGAVVLGAHSVGAPHIRQRFYFVAHAERGAAERWRLDVAAEARGTQDAAQERQRVRADAGDGGDARELAHAMPAGRPEGWTGAGSGSPTGGAGLVEYATGEQVGIPRRARVAGEAAGLVGDADDAGPQGRGEHWHGADECAPRTPGVAGFWSNAEWLPCTDGKLRPVEPGVEPLVTGAPARVGRLRAYGNALCAETAVTFIRGVIEAQGGR
jgi:DNA (cytosine-5)-methyltransferase 1